MLEKMILSDKECENITKSIAGGVGIGLSLGAIFNNPQFGFALGGVVGVIASLVYSLVKRSKENKGRKEIINID
ncbi:hypothetical protein [Clostridium sp. B9]|uniref:hypothetical protein n=1 Tax=Clostridium sp. B9 TaxID=3423224 RepID=UPI003D2EC2DB